MSKSLKILQEKSCSSSAGAAEIQRSGVAIKNFKGRASLVTLGCAKNQVDSEVMLGALEVAGFEIVNDIKSADVAIINTCGFLQASVKESLDAVLEAAEYKKTGRLRKLIVAGCLVERYKGELENTLPEVDAFISTDDLLKVGKVAIGDEAHFLDASARPYFLYDDTMPRVLSTRQHTAYVKISEGCNRPCTFCIIPRIRGQMRSRSIDSVVKEVKELGERGVNEINLVAQDLTAYGKDLDSGNLSDLLENLSSIKTVSWIRLLYAYPIGVDERLLKLISTQSNICRYLDIPLQHSSETVLKNMQRPLGRFSPRKVVEFIKGNAPSIAIRTTFIVGFPGETEEDVDDLIQFIEEGHFMNVGVFIYSPEEGTPSHEMTNQIPDSVKKKRRDRVMKSQQKVIMGKLNGMIGKTLSVLIEGSHEDTDLLLTGRAQFQAPEVDGIVIINDKPEDLKVDIGSFYEVEITEVAGYDLVGKVIAPERQSALTFSQGHLNGSELT